MAVGENDVSKKWKEYLQDMYKMDAKDRVIVNMFKIGIVGRSRYFLEEPESRTQVKVRVRELRNVRLKLNSLPRPARKII